MSWSSAISWGGCIFVWLLAGHSAYRTWRLNKLEKARIADIEEATERVGQMMKGLQELDGMFRERAAFGDFALAVLASKTSDEQAVDALRLKARMEGLLPTTETLQ